MGEPRNFKMKTQEELEQKLVKLENSIDNFKEDSIGLKLLKLEISTLKYVLKKGPEIILFPKESKI